VHLDTGTGENADCWLAKQISTLLIRNADEPLVFHIKWDTSDWITIDTDPFQHRNISLVEPSCSSGTFG